MYQTIGEEIAVAGVYARGKFVPRRFRWKQRDYSIARVTFSANMRDGGVQLRHYAVEAEGNLYRLLFHRDDETWMLAEVWCE